MGIEEAGGVPLDDRFSLRVTELVFETYADPYAKGFIDLSASNLRGQGEEVEVEEGYRTWLVLPYDLKAKAGKFSTDFGNINLTHGHALPQVDRPKVITNFFGPEGFIGRGLSLSWLTPARWYSELIVEATNGENEKSLAGEECDDPAMVADTKNCFEIGNASKSRDRWQLPPGG